MGYQAKPLVNKALRSTALADSINDTYKYTPTDKRASVGKMSKIALQQSLEKFRKG